MAFEVSKDKVEGLDVKECFMEGWNTFKNNPLDIFIAACFLVVGSLLSIGILSGSLYAGFFSYVVKVRAGDKEAKHSEIFSKFNILLPSLIVIGSIFIANLANNFIIGGIFGWAISTLTGLLVGAIAYCLLSISIPLLSTSKVEKASDAMQSGWDTFLLSPKKFFLLSVCGHILNFLGALCLGIGLLITIPITLCTTVVVFEKLNKAE